MTPTAFKFNEVQNRRQFLTKSIKATALAMSAPYLIPAKLKGNSAPHNRITIGCIGVGRMGMSDLQDIIQFDDIQVVAVCDVDSWRLENAKNYVENYYQAKQEKGRYKGCSAYEDFREVIARSDIDAVMIVTPDHWHALPAIAAAQAGKDIFLEKPLTLTIPEGRKLSDTVKKYNRVLQVGSMQRSDANFRFAVELVLNGRIGKLHTIKIGFGKDPFTGVHPPTSVPNELNYDMWLGPAPYVPYVEARVHPQKSYDRPGWLRVSEYCCGMITGWGSHHLDIAHWGMGKERSGPIEIKGKAEYSPNGSWDVHGAFEIEYWYDNGVKMICTENERNKEGIVFEGTEGWVHVRRWTVDASPASLLNSKIEPNEIHVYKSDNHKKNFIDCIRSRRETVAPVEIGHRSASVCILGYLAMLTERRLKWDPICEQFIRDEAANQMLSRSYRSPWHL